MGTQAAKGREQRRAASSPPLRPGLGSASPRSFRSPPRSGTGRSEPLPGARGTLWPPPRVPMEPPNLYPVKLYVYDLSKGLARRLSPIMLGEGAGGGQEGGPGRPAEVGRPGPSLGGDVGPRGWRKEGRGLRFRPLCPTWPFESWGKGRRGIAPCILPYPFRVLSSGRWGTPALGRGTVPRLASPLAPSTAQR